MKFGIGTAIFINNYGIIKNDRCHNDLPNLFKKYNKKIDLIDTAPSYGNAEKILGINKNKKLKIVTKIDKLKNKQNKIQLLSFGLKKSLINLKSKKVYCLMFHSEKDVSLLKDYKFKRQILNFKKKGIIKKIGISCYDINKIPLYLEIFKFDVIQFPLNVFSINKKKLDFLNLIKKKYKLEFHIRSIYLQGLVFGIEKNLKKKFFYLDKKISIVKNFCKHKKISLIQFYTSALKSIKICDYLIVGIKNINEYDQIKKNKFIKIEKKFIYSLYLKNQKNLDPRYW